MTKLIVSLLITGAIVWVIVEFIVMMRRRQREKEKFEKLDHLVENTQDRLTAIEIEKMAVELEKDVVKAEDELFDEKQKIHANMEKKFKDIDAIVSRLEERDKNDV